MSCAFLWLRHSLYSFTEAHSDQHSLWYIPALCKVIPFHFLCFIFIAAICLFSLFFFLYSSPNYCESASYYSFLLTEAISISFLHFLLAPLKATTIDVALGRVITEIETKQKRAMNNVQNRLKNEAKRTTTLAGG